MLKVHLLRFLSNATERLLHTSFSCLRDVCYYEVLEIKRSSTASEIKTAYYKLSMLYHPDKNEGCDDAAKKFREITEAYEILGNATLRKVYDRSIARNTNVQMPKHSDIRDDIAQDVKFYKSRFRRSKGFNPRDRTKYNFEEWEKAHYGDVFHRSQRDKRMYQDIKIFREEAKPGRERDYAVLSIILFGLVSFMFLTTEKNFDKTPERYDSGQSVDEQTSSSTKIHNSDVPIKSKFP